MRDEAQRKLLNERQSNNCSLPLSKLQQPLFFFFPFLPRQAISQSAALFGSGAGDRSADRKVVVDKSVQFSGINSDAQI